MAQEWSYVGYAASGSGTGNLTVDVPSGVQNGDQLVWVVDCSTSNTYPTVTLPGGWTQQTSFSYSHGGYLMRIVIGTRTASSEPTNYTVTISGGDTPAHGTVIIAYRGVTFDAISAGTGYTNANSSTSLTSASVTAANSDSLFLHIVAGATYIDDFINPPSGMTGRTAAAQTECATLISDKNVASGSQSATGSIVNPYSTHANVFGMTFRPWVRMQSTTSMALGSSSNLGMVWGLGATGAMTLGSSVGIQAVRTFGSSAPLAFGGSGLLEGTPALDFTVYDLYMDDNTTNQGMIMPEGEQYTPQTVTRRLTPVRTDVGNNPNEVRPDFGDVFSQTDWINGAGQQLAHGKASDARRFYWSEGFDISQSGRLTHLNDVAEGRNSANVGALAVCKGKIFVADGTTIYRCDTFPSTWTEDSPHLAEGATTVYDLAPSGDELFAAVGINGIHKRDTAGTWTHYVTYDGTNAITKVAWVKDRLICADAGRKIYEITASGALPTALETLPVGWTFQAIWEAGGFIHAAATNADAGMSRVHHYGLNSGGTAIEKKSSTPMPQGQLVFSGAGYLGLCYLGVGKAHPNGGYTPIVYTASISETNGSLNYIKLAEDTADPSTTDLGVKAILPIGDEVLIGWTLPSGSFGGARDGLAVHNLARDSFVNHLKKAGTGGKQAVLDIVTYKGQVVFTLAGDGVYYQDVSKYVSSAQVVSSAADWGNAGLKVWDTVTVNTITLPSTTTVAMAYSTAPHESASWNTVFTHSSGTTSSGRLSNIKSKLLILRATSAANATQTAAPTLLGYEARSVPSPVSTEFECTRYVRLLDRDRKDEDGAIVFQDPDLILAWLQSKAYTWVKIYEPNVSWTAFLSDVSTVEPAQPYYDITLGQPARNAYLIRLAFTGVKV